jgi:hypothetical protein
MAFPPAGNAAGTREADSGCAARGANPLSYSARVWHEVPMMQKTREKAGFGGWEEIARPLGDFRFPGQCQQYQPCQPAQAMVG